MPTCSNSGGRLCRSAYSGDARGCRGSAPARYMSATLRRPGTANIGSRATRVVAESPARVLDESQLCAAVRIGKELGVGHRHHIIVRPVQQEERPRRERARTRDRIDGGNVSSPRGNITGRILAADHAHPSTVTHEAVRITRPVGEIRRRSECRDSSHPRIVRADSERQRPSDSGPEHPHPDHLRIGEHGVDRQPEVRIPCGDGKVALGSTRSLKIEREHPPPDLSRDAIGELRERETGGDRTARRGGEVVTQHECRARATHAGPRPVRGEGRAVNVFYALVQQGSSVGPHYPGSS